MTNEQVSQEADYLYKSLNAQFNIDEAQGIVEAFVAGIGNKDSVGDICLPGCFTSSLKRRKPRVVWGHDWNSPIGKVLEIYEVGPNDPRLPAKMRKAGIGGLYARVQFNLKAEKGKEAFANVSFFGMEQEWSIGYKTLDAVFDPVQTANLLKEVELYEVSPVLHGANQLTGTISIKADSVEAETKEKAASKPVLRDPKGGLTAAGRAHFRRTEGANLKPGVKGPADTPEKMRRKGSFLTRFFTNPSGPMKKPNGEPTRLALSAAAWGEPVPKNASDAAKLAAKGRRLLERYENTKKKKKDDSDSVESKNHVAAIYAAMTSPQNEVFGRASQLTRALATRFGGPVRLVTADNDIAVFEMGAGDSTETMRVAYHYDGDEFMFGTAQKVKPETVYIPVNDSNAGQIQNGVAMGISPIEDKPGSHCCPGCAHGGNCDATVALGNNENPKIAFLKLKSLGDQLDFKVVPVDGGFVLQGFGFLTEEAQNYVIGKIENEPERKLLNPVGSLARRTIGVPNARASFNVNTNPFTARDADLDKLVLEGNPLINFGRGIPDPTPFGTPDIPAVGKPGVPERYVPNAGGRRPIAPRMPAVPEPDEIPEPVREPKREPKPERTPVTPRRPNREPVPAPPEREPITEPSVPQPEKEPVPVPRRPEREPARPTVPVPPRRPVPVGRASNEDFAIAAMGGGRRTPKELADELAQLDSSDRPSRQTRQRRVRDSGIDQMRRLALLDDAEAGMSGPDSREFLYPTDDESREREFYELMMDERRADEFRATGDRNTLRPEVLRDILNDFEEENGPDYVPTDEQISDEAILRAEEATDSFINEDYGMGWNPVYKGRNNRDLWDRRDEIFEKYSQGGLTGRRTYGEREQLIESQFTFANNERIYLDPVNGRLYQADFYDRDTDDEAPLPDFNIDDYDSVGYDDMGNLVYRTPNGNQIIFSREQLGSTGTDAGMASRKTPRSESTDLGRKIWLERTHDRISLEEAGRRNGITKQEARQLELRHQKYLRDLGVDHPNRVLRSRVDDPSVGLTDAEKDLLRRRLDGETLEEAAKRLRTDRFAVRRMEQLVLAKMRNGMAGDETSAGMAARSGGRAVEADRPKARRAKGPVSRRKRNAVDPTFLQILDSLKDSGPTSITSRQRIRLASMMRLRTAIQNKINYMLATDARKRRLSNLGPEIEDLNKGIRGPFESLAEAARLATGRPSDLVSSVIKTANGDHDPLDLDGSINVQVFEAMLSTGGDVAAVARLMGMDEEVVKIRTNAHAMRVLASSRPAKMKIHRRIEDMGDKLTSAEKIMLRMWINGASNLDIAEKMSSGMDEKSVISSRSAALKKIGIDVNSPELTSKIVSGRIFYDEHGLFFGLTDEAGGTTYNKIGDGPSAGMANKSTSVVEADFGDGRREYAVSRVVARDRSSGNEESVMLIPLRGDDETTVSALVGRALLGEDSRGFNLEFPATLTKSGGRIVAVSDGRGKAIPYYGERTFDPSEPVVMDGPLRLARTRARKISALRENDTASRIKTGQDVIGSEARYSNLVKAMDRLVSTGDWIGGDLGVTGRVPDADTMLRYGIDADVDGSPIVPSNASREQFVLRQAEWFLERNPNATAEELDSFVEQANEARINQIGRKIDLAGKELARVTHVRDSMETRRAQNVVDLETLDPEIARALSEETAFISGLSGTEMDSSGISRGADGFVYVVHKGPDRLAGGVLDPSRSVGRARNAIDVAGQGDTRGANRIYVDRLVQSAKAESEMAKLADDLLASVSRGDRSISVAPAIRASLASYSPLMARVMNGEGYFNLENFDEAGRSAIALEIGKFASLRKERSERYGKIMESLRKHGGNSMDQILSAEADPISALLSTNFYGRYADADLPEDVVAFKPGFVDNLTRRWDPLDEEMLRRWDSTGSLRGGAFLAVGREDSEIVRGGLLGPTSEAQIVAPLKPLIGVSTPVSVLGDDSESRALVSALGPAIVARAIKMHKRDGFVDVETVLTDPDLAPSGFSYAEAEAEAGMAAFEPRRPMLDERGRLDPVLTRDEAIADDRDERASEGGPIGRLLVPQSSSVFVEAPPNDLTPETRRAPWAVGYTDSAADVMPELGYPQRMVHVVSPSALPPDNTKFPVGDEGELLMLDQEPIDFLAQALNDVNGLTRAEKEEQREALGDRGFDTEADPDSDFTPIERSPIYLVVETVNEPGLQGPGYDGRRRTRIVRVREIPRMRLSVRADDDQPGGGPYWRSLDAEAVARGEPGRTTTEGLGFLDLLIDVDPNWDGDLVDDTRVVRVKPESIVGRIVSESELENTSRITREIYSGEGAYTATYRRPISRFGDETEAGMTTTKRGMDLVGRTNKYRPGEDGEYVIPESVMSRRDQDRMFEIARTISSGEFDPLDWRTEGELAALLEKAENVFPIKPTRRHPHHDDERLGRLKDVTRARNDFVYPKYRNREAMMDFNFGQLLSFDPNTSVYSYLDGVNQEVQYIPVRIGRTTFGADDFSYHPASRIGYVRLMQNEKGRYYGMKKWNHPNNSDPNSYGSAINWTDEGDSFDLIEEEGKFHLSRNKTLDDRLGFLGDSPQKILAEIARRAPDYPSGETSFWDLAMREIPSFDGDGYPTRRRTGYAELPGTPTVTESTDVNGLRLLIDAANRDGVGLKLSVVAGFRPGEKSYSRVADSEVFMPRLARGEIDPTTREFVSDLDGMDHLIGFDSSGTAIAHELSDVLMNNETSPSSPRRSVDYFPDYDDDVAEAGMSAPIERYVRTTEPTRDEEGTTEGRREVQIVDLPSTQSARNGGNYDDSAASVITAAVNKVRAMDSDAGADFNDEKHGLTFSYPSSVKGTPGKKELRNRTLINPIVVYGEYDPETNETYILATDETGVTRLVPMSKVDLRAMVAGDPRAGDHSGNPDVQDGTYATYVVGEEIVGGKTQTRIFNTERMKPVLGYPRTTSVGDDRGVQATPDERIVTQPRPTTTETESAPGIEALDSDDPFLLQNMEPPRPEAFDGGTTMPVSDADVGFIPKTDRPTAWEVAKGLAMDDPKAIAARKADEMKLWDKIRRGTKEWLKPWTKKSKEIKDDSGLPVINPATGRPFYRSPYRKPWTPWGNPLDENGKELPEGIRGELDKIRSWREFGEWLKTKKLAFFDAETTGIPNGSLETGQALQIAVILVEEGKFDKPKRLEIWINPGSTPLEPWVLKNIKYDGKPIPDALRMFPEKFESLEQAKQKIAEFIGRDAVVLSHNFRNFDSQVWGQLMGDHPTLGWIDTLAVANWMFAIDNERAQMINGLERSSGKYSMTNWFTSLVKIAMPGGKPWGSKGRKPGSLERIARRATGPLGFTPALSKKKAIAQWFPKTYGSQSNEALAKYFGIPQVKAHDAMEDAWVSARAFLEVIALGEKWDSSSLMFNPEWVKWVQYRTDEQYSADVSEWRRANGITDGQRETLFDSEPNQQRPTPPPGPGSSGGGSDRGPSSGGGSGGDQNPPNDGSWSIGGDDPDRRFLYQAPNGVKVFEGDGGVYFELTSVSPSDGEEQSVLVAKTISDARLQGYGFQFNYGTKPNGEPSRYRLLSVEVVPKKGVDDARARQLGLSAWELHGIDVADGKLKRFELSLLNASDASEPKVSDLTELPLFVYGDPNSRMVGIGDGKPRTPQQYADYARRVTHNRGRTDDGPSAGMSGLTNRDGVTNSTNYWTADQNDYEMVRMTDEQLVSRLSSDRTRFENLFHAGPGENVSASKVLDSVAAANRIMRLRSNDSTDNNGFTVALSRSGYKLSGSFSPPPGVMDGSYVLPSSYVETRSEMAKNAKLSMMLDFSIANGGFRNAVERASRLSRIPTKELIGRIAAHDYPTYAEETYYRKFRNASELISGGTATPSSLGLLIDPSSDPRAAAILTDRAAMILGVNTLGYTGVFARGGRNYSQMETSDLMNEFNESVSDLFSFDHSGSYEKPEFRIKSDAIRDSLRKISDEMRNRYFSSLPEASPSSSVSDEAEAGMSSGNSPFGEADGLPILSGSKWLDARLHAIYGDVEYEKQAAKFGDRFRTLPQRNWDSPTDDDLVDVYHYATMLHHDALIEELTRRNERSDMVDFASSDPVDNGSISVMNKVSDFSGVPKQRIGELISRGRDVAVTRRLAAMDPFARAEEMDAIRRRKAFARLIEDKKRELGDDFAAWLAAQSIKGESETRTGRRRSEFEDLIGSSGGGFFDETPGEAMDGLSDHMGMDRDESDGDDTEAGMAGRRPFIRQRYDVKPVDGGFVIIDLDNRNAVSSRVFKDKREALRGAAKMDRGDRSFDPFASPQPTPPPRTISEAIASDPAVPKPKNSSDAQPSLFDDNGDPNVGMSSGSLPNRLRFSPRKRNEERISRDNVRTAMTEYETGRASIPYPSPEDVPVSRLMGGYATADSSLHTVIGRLEQIASAPDDEAPGAETRDEITSLISNMEKLQKRRNYFYNQLRDRLDSSDPIYQTLEGWHAERAGLDRESTTRFGSGNLPGYVLPSGLGRYGLSDSQISPKYSNQTGDAAFLENMINDAISEYSSDFSVPKEEEYYIRSEMNRVLRSIQNDVSEMSRKNRDSVMKFGQRSARIGAQTIVAASRLSTGDDVRKAILSAGLKKMMQDGGVRLGLAYLINAVDVGLITQSDAKTMLRNAKSSSDVVAESISKTQSMTARSQMSRMISDMSGASSGRKSSERGISDKRLSMITETLSSELVK